MKMTLSYIASVVDGELTKSANCNRTVEGFYTDSRVPSYEKIFLALQGERVDGNSFASALMKNGYAVMTDRKENLSLEGDAIYVHDVRSALQCLAKHYRENDISGIPTIGITGSVGKTTTKDMVACALSSAFKVHKTQGNFNSQVGLPQTVLATDPDVDCAVVELGMSLKGEMERISACAQPDISVVTNIGYSHIENLGTREAIRDEKLKISAFSKNGSILLLNGDEPLLRDVEYENRKIYYVSVENPHCDCYATNIIETKYGVSFDACVFGKEVLVELGVSGRHFVLNALFALAVCDLLGIDVLIAAKSLAMYESDGKRQHIYDKDGHVVISDCYNASPESMKAALSVLASYEQRRIAVLGDMLELGSESENLHQLVGDYTNYCADVLVTYGLHSRSINSASRIAEKYHFNMDEKDKLFGFLKSFVKKNDVVLYKASNGIKLSEIIV